MSETNYRLSVSRDEFSKLLMLLKVFENTCTDCDIKDGLFRCRSNDRQAVIHMDMKAILDDKDLMLSLIKNKVASLQTFELDDNVQVEDKTVVIESNESNYEFRDPFTNLSFRKPVQRYIDNQFITEDEFNSIIQISEDNLLFSTTLNNYLKRRISNVSLTFVTDYIDCIISEGKANFSIKSSNKEDTSALTKEIVMNRDVGNKTFKISTLPFTLDIASDLKIDCYTTNQNEVYICKFSQSFFGVPITIFTKVKVTNV